MADPPVPDWIRHYVDTRFQDHDKVHDKVDERFDAHDRTHQKEAQAIANTLAAKGANQDEKQWGGSLLVTVGFGVLALLGTLASVTIAGAALLYAVTK